LVFADKAQLTYEVTDALCRGWRLRRDAARWLADELCGIVFLQTSAVIAEH
jgi:hypothetical protein